MPLFAPQFGVYDMRISSALQFSGPVAMLTTSSAVADVTRPLDKTDQSRSGPAYQQHTSDVKREVSTAIWRSHNLRVGDLVLVSPGSIRVTTTSGKIRRSSVGALYRRVELQRLDVSG